MYKYIYKRECKKCSREHDSSWNKYILHSELRCLLYSNSVQYPDCTEVECAEESRRAGLDGPVPLP